MLTLNSPSESAGLPGCHRLRGVALHFSPFLGFCEDGDQFWAIIFTVAQSLAQVLHATGPSLSICACRAFNPPVVSSVRCTN